MFLSAETWYHAGFVYIEIMRISRIQEFSSAETNFSQDFLTILKNFEETVLKLIFFLLIFEETRYALSEETYVSPLAMD